MIRHTGHGTYESVTLALLGDGQSKSVNVALDVAPFALDFKKQFTPITALYLLQDGKAPQSITFNGSTLSLTFAEALPAPSPGKLSPRTQLEIYLIYEAPAIPLASDRKHKKRRQAKWYR